MRLGTARKPSKYKNKITEYNGMKFPSKAEAKQAQDLDFAKEIGAIRGWVKQVRFMLGVPENVYIADFVVWTNNGTCYAIDVKGKRTAKFERDVKLWARYAPINLHIVTGGKCVEVITPECLRGTNEH